MFTTAKVPLSFRISGAPNPVVFGGPFSIQGTLSGTGVADRTVALQVDPFPYLGGMVGTGNPEVTTASGSFSFPVIDLLKNARYRVVTVGGAPVSSPVIVEDVAVRATLYARRVHRRAHGRYYRLYGTVTPAETGVRIGFQLLRSGSDSTNEGGTLVKTTGKISRFSTVVPIRHPGLYSVLAPNQRWLSR